MVAEPLGQASRGTVELIKIASRTSWPSSSPTLTPDDILSILPFGLIGMHAAEDLVEHGPGAAPEDGAEPAAAVDVAGAERGGRDVRGGHRAARHREQAVTARTQRRGAGGAGRLQPPPRPAVHPGQEVALGPGRGEGEAVRAPEDSPDPVPALCVLVTLARVRHTVHTRSSAVFISRRTPRPIIFNVMDSRCLRDSFESQTCRGF